MLCHVSVFNSLLGLKNISLYVYTTFCLHSLLMDIWVNFHNMLHLEQEVDSKTVQSYPMVAHSSLLSPPLYQGTLCFLAQAGWQFLSLLGHFYYCFMSRTETYTTRLLPSSFLARIVWGPLPASILLLRNHFQQNYSAESA